MTPTDLAPTATATASTDSNISTRTLANRSNAQSSTGPRTDAGKDRVRHNALQHGLYAVAAVIPGESDEDYRRLGAHLAERFSPLTPEATELVATLHDAQWRLKRVIALETKMHIWSAAQHLDSVEAEFGPLDPETLRGLAAAAGYRADSRIFSQLNRQEAKLRKLIETTTRALNESAVHQPQPAPAPRRVAVAPIPAAVPVAAVSAAIPTPANDLGFVPSLSPATAQPVATAPKMPKFSGPLAAQHRKNWLRKQKLAVGNRA